MEIKFVLSQDWGNVISYYIYVNNKKTYYFNILKNSSGFWGLYLADTRGNVGYKTDIKKIPKEILTRINCFIHLGV